MTANMYLGGDPNKVDASGYTFGDILAADITGTLEPVTVGPDGDVLTADSVAPEGVDYQPGGGGGGGTPSNTVVTETSFGQASTAGALTTFSRGDHTHGTPASPTVPGPAATVVTETTFGQASAVGTGTTYARNDHTHGTPAAPTIPSSSATVVTETAFGQASAAGAAATFSRGDHTHGTPTAPTVPAAASTVVSETSFGQSPVVGTDTIYARQDHTHGTPAAPSSGTLEIAGTGFITSGNITVNSSSFQVGTDLTVPAAAGHIIEITMEMLCSDSGADLQFDAATRVSAADVNFFSTGTNTSRFPGGLGNWYVQTGRFESPRGTARLTLVGGDVSGGNVTVRLYGQVPAGSRVIFANSTYPLRVWLTNYGPG